MVSVVTTTEMRITQGTSGALRTDTTLVITTSRLTVTVIKTIRVIKGLVTEATMGRSMEVIIPDTGKDIILNTEEAIIPETKEDMVTVGILIKIGLMIFHRDSSVTSTTTVRILLQVVHLLIIGIRGTANGMEALTMNPDTAHHRTQGLQLTINIRMVNVVMVAVGLVLPPAGITARAVRTEGPIESSIRMLRIATNE